MKGCVGRVVGLLLLFVMGAQPCFGADQDDWHIETQGAWRVQPDNQRDLLRMAHPWTSSETGGFALAWRTMRIPEDWEGPFFLSVYCSDDYHTDAWQPDGSRVSAEGFIGHRFKQVMVDKEVVWSEDVSDAVAPGTPEALRVPIPVQAGQEFRLSMLVYDRAASTEILEGDFFQAADGTTLRPEQDGEAFHFRTNVYWGGLVLVPGDAQPRTGQRPSENKVRLRHKEQTALGKTHGGWSAKTARLRVDGAEGVPKAGFPAQCGIPLPPGKVTDASAMRLQNFKALAVHTQKTPLSYWPDGSIRWMLIDFPVTPWTKSIDLAFRKDVARPTKTVTLKETGAGLLVSSGAVSFEAQPGDLLSTVKRAGHLVFPTVRTQLRVDHNTLPGSTGEARIQADGPFRGTLAVSGRYDNLSQRSATFTAYCSAYAGLPYLKIDFHLFNDTEQDLRVSALELEFDFEKAPGDFRMGERALGATVNLMQNTEQSCTVNGEAVITKAPVCIAWNGGAIVLRRFRERYPKAIHTRDGALVVDLIPGGETPVVLTPGESQSDELWIAFGSIDTAAFAAAVETPPIFSNPDYYCATGVIGPARPYNDIPALKEAVQKRYGEKSWGELGQRYGLRHFPDAPYGELPNWTNNYQDRMMGLWSQWFMSGDRVWHDRAVDLCRHLMDTALVHSPVPGRDWFGAMHGPGKNHVPGPWAPAQRAEGLNLYHKLTGQPEAVDAFLAMADYCVRVQAGLQSNRARNHAAPLDTLSVAYQETMDPLFIDQGVLRMEAIWKNMDRRRGVWAEEHGSKVYRGNVPWIDAQLGRSLYRWYHATGDIEAAQALVALAESMILENTAGEDGEMNGYSHNPRLATTANYDLLILPVLFAAYELTDDKFFLKAATAQYHRYCREQPAPAIFNTYAHTPWLAWYLDIYDVKPPETSKEGE
jgi:hypothetical protein